MYIHQSDSIWSLILLERCCYIYQALKQVAFTQSENPLSIENKLLLAQTIQRQVSPFQAEPRSGLPIVSMSKLRNSSAHTTTFPGRLHNLYCGLHMFRSAPLLSLYPTPLSRRITDRELVKADFSISWISGCLVHESREGSNY